MKAEVLRQKINKLSSEGVPFLFAVDFELSRGMLIPNPLEQQEILFRTPIASNVAETPFPANVKDNAIIPYPEPYASYLEKFHTKPYKLSITAIRLR